MICIEYQLIEHEISWLLSKNTFWLTILQCELKNYTNFKPFIE